MALIFKDLLGLLTLNHSQFLWCNHFVWKPRLNICQYLLQATFNSHFKWSVLKQRKRIWHVHVTNSWLLKLKCYFSTPQITGCLSQQKLTIYRWTELTFMLNYQCALFLDKRSLKIKVSICGLSDHVNKETSLISIMHQFQLCWFCHFLLPNVIDENSTPKGYFS